MDYYKMHIYWSTVTALVVLCAESNDPSTTNHYTVNDKSAINISSPRFSINPDGINTTWSFSTPGQGFRIQFQSFNFVENYHFLQVGNGIDPHITNSEVVMLHGNLSGDEIYINAPNMWLRLTSSNGGAAPVFHAVISEFNYQPKDHLRSSLLSFEQSLAAQQTDVSSNVTAYLVTQEQCASLCLTSIWNCEAFVYNRGEMRCSLHATVPSAILESGVDHSNSYGFERHKPGQTSNSCGPEGREIMGRCFTVATGSLPGSSPLSVCQSQFQNDSFPAVIISKDLQNSLEDAFRGNELPYYRYYRFGLEVSIGPLSNSKSSHTWIDGTPLNYENLLQDDMEDNTERPCAYISSSYSYKWSIRECGNTPDAPVLCQLDINECLQWNNNCSHGCVDITGGFYCTCPEGFYLDPYDRTSCKSTCDITTGFVPIGRDHVCIYKANFTVPYDEAVTLCNDLGGSLIDENTVLELSEELELKVGFAQSVWVLCPADVDCRLQTLAPAYSAHNTECSATHHFICVKHPPNTTEIRMNHGSGSEDLLETVYRNEGYFSWIGIPPLYSHSTTTRFHLLVDAGKSIRLKLVYLSLRVRKNSIGCMDSVKVIENFPVSQIIRDEYCGLLKDFDIQLTTNNATIEIDIAKLTGKMPSTLDFHASFTGLNCSRGGCITDCPAEPYTGTSGEVVTPNFPSPLEAYFSCTWRITVRNGSYVRLDFLTLNLECGSARYTKLHLRTPEEIPFRVCGAGPFGITIAKSNTLDIELKTGLGEGFPGFRANFSENEIPGCGFAPYRPSKCRSELCTAPSAVLASKNFPHAYNEGFECSWNIQTAEGTYIALKFEVFNITSEAANCSQDHIRLKTGPIIKRICNANINELENYTFYSLKNALKVQLITDKSGPGSLFKAVYTARTFIPQSSIEIEGRKCEDGWTNAGTQCYRLIQNTSLVNWREAAQTCSNLGSTLAVIRSQAEMDFIQKMVIDEGDPKEKFYIGLWWESKKNRFRWVNGQPLALSHWYTKTTRSVFNKSSCVCEDWRLHSAREPDGGGLEKCVVVNIYTYRDTSNSWYDISCITKSTGQFVCQKDAELKEGATKTDDFPQLIYTSESDPTCNSQTQYRCKSGECVLQVYLCDGTDDCSDGSDEHHCTNSTGVTCGKTEFHCGENRCIPASFYCDFQKHCMDGSDEAGCSYPECGTDEFRCSSGSCIPASYKCDLKDDCLDRSDEIDCTFSTGTFRCFSDQLLPSERECDGYKDCAGKYVEDEHQDCDYLQDSFSCNESYQLQCRNGVCADLSSLCIYEDDPYKYQKGCRDDTHLLDCRNFECPVGYFKCPSSYCIPVRYRCNGEQDCPMGEDELHCDNYTCPVGSYRCHGERQKMCLHQDQVCDSLYHCAEGDDELFCDVTCYDGCNCSGQSVDCSSGKWSSTRALGLPRHLKQLWLAGVQSRYRVVREILSKTSIGDAVFITPSDFGLLLTLDLSSNGVKVLFPGDFKGNTNLMELNLANNLITSMYKEMFEGLTKLKYMNLVGNPLVTTGDQSFSFLVGLEILEASFSKIRIGSVDHSFFHGMDSLKSLHSDRFFFCCLVDIDNCTPDAGQFSNCQDLMKNRFLRISVWILSFIALFGNGFVIFWRVYRRGILPGNTSTAVQSTLITNLAVADFMVGIYMLIIAVADIRFREIYYKHSEAWQAGSLCKLAGVLSVLGSEASVMLLTVITITRLLGILNPLSTKNLRVKATWKAVGFIWFLSFFVSIFPLIAFRSSDDDRGFYGRSSVCLALPLTNDYRSGWLYSVVLFLIFNLICCLVMVVSYIIMYIKAKQSQLLQVHMTDIQQKRIFEKQLQIATKMSILIATDMACWLPIILMGFLSLFNVVEIQDDVYAWTAVFVLPVNSALNPYLYTLFGTTWKRSRRPSCVEASHANNSSNQSGEQVFRKGDIMATLCGSFRQKRIIVATTSTVEKYLLANLKKGDDFVLTEHNRADIAGDIEKAVKYLHDIGITHGNINEQHVLIDELQNNEKRAYLLLPIAWIISPRYIENSTPDDPLLSHRREDTEDLDTLIRGLEDCHGPSK